MKRCLISFIRNEVKKEVKTTVSSLASGPFPDAGLCPLARTQCTVKDRVSLMLPLHLGSLSCLLLGSPKEGKACPSTDPSISLGFQVLKILDWLPEVRTEC